MTDGFQYSAAGASAAAGGYPLDIPPAGPSAYDDEFTGTTLDPKWEGINPAQSVIATVANSWLLFEPAVAGTASTGKRAFGIRQPSPAGSFTISTKLALPRNPASDDCRGALFVATTGGTANILGSWQNGSDERAHNALGVSTYSETVDWGPFDGFDSFLDDDYGPSEWHKLVWNSATSQMQYWYSHDGVVFQLEQTRNAQPQPDRLGLVLYSNAATLRADRKLCCDWVRVTVP